MNYAKIEAWLSQQKCCSRPTWNTKHDVKFVNSAAVEIGEYINLENQRRKWNGQNLSECLSKTEKETRKNDRANYNQTNESPCGDNSQKCKLFYFQRVCLVNQFWHGKQHNCQNGQHKFPLLATVIEISATTGCFVSPKWNGPSWLPFLPSISRAKITAAKI